MAPTPAHRYMQTTDFTVLQHVLVTYFPATGIPGRKDRQVEFLRAYGRDGESRAEFAGLLDELRFALKHPQRAATIVNDALGLDGDDEMSVAEVRTSLADMVDQLTGEGVYAQRADDADTDSDSVEASEDANAASFLRSTPPLPKWAGGRPVPLWTLVAASVAVLALGWLLGRSWMPHPVQAFGWLVTLLGAFGLVASATAVLSLRSDALHPDRAAERDAKIAAAAEQPWRPWRR